MIKTDDLLKPILSITVGFLTFATCKAFSGEPAAVTFIPMVNADIIKAPYVWHCTGEGRQARAEAAMPGAYVKLRFRDSALLRVLIDGAANEGCPPAAMPVVDYSLDNGPFHSIQLTKTDGLYPLTMAEKLDAGKEHQLEVYFRSASLGPNRWKASTVHLRLAGIELSDGGRILPCAVRPKRAIGFGDSITEGVCNEGQCPYYSNLMMNNARATWFPMVCSALNCEYGQLGTGGQGMVKRLDMPPLPETWDRYDADHSRLTDGRLNPEPDYIFCAMGTNDYRPQSKGHAMLPIAEAYLHWLQDVRKACPTAKIFCIVPPLGWHADEIAQVVSARNKTGDHNVYLIDTAPLKSLFDPIQETPLAADGVHPSVYGNAMLGGLIVAEAQKTLCNPN
jgi:hypothetical protein